MASFSTADIRSGYPRRAAGDSGHEQRQGESRQAPAHEHAVTHLRDARYLTHTQACQHPPCQIGCDTASGGPSTRIPAAGASSANVSAPDPVVVAANC